MSVSRVAPPIDQSPVPSVASETPQTPKANPVDKSQLVGLVDKVKTTIDALGDTLTALDKPDEKIRWQRLSNFRAYPAPFLPKRRLRG